MAPHFSKPQYVDQKYTKEVHVDGKKLVLKKFNAQAMTKLAENPAVVMIAKRGSGKSVAVGEIMRINSDIPGGVVISRTEKMSPFFTRFFPDTFIYNTYESSILESLLERQVRMKQKKAYYLERGQKVDSRAWLVMDDCLSNKGAWAKDEAVLEVMLNGRHYDLFFMLTMQYPLGIGPDLRSNFDFIFIFGENYTNIRKKIYEHYAGMFKTFEAFEYVFSKVTKGHSCMVINNRIKSDKIEDLVFWWTATDPKEQKKYEGDSRYIGHKTFKEYHKKNYNDDYNKGGYKRGKDVYDIMAGKRRKMDKFDVELADAG